MKRLVFSLCVVFLSMIFTSSGVFAFCLCGSGLCLPPPECLQAPKFVGELAATDSLNNLFVSHSILYLGGERIGTSGATMYQYTPTATPVFKATMPPPKMAENKSVETSTGGGPLFQVKGLKILGTDDAEVWTFDGNTWTEVTPPAPGFSGNKGVYSMAVYKDTLFIGTGNNSGAQVWAFNGAWTEVNIPGFSSNNSFVWAMTVYKDSLYIATVNYTGPAELWKYDGSAWSQVNIPDFSSNNYAIASMATFNGNLYLGTSNVSSGAELWQFKRGTWKKISSSGLASNNSITAMAKYEGALLIGTSNYYGDAAQLWTFDGSAKTQISLPGFSANNTGIVSMYVFGNTLYLGTYNTSGAQVWKIGHGL
jgi:hypothetical protein